MNQIIKGFLNSIYGVNDSEVDKESSTFKRLENNPEEDLNQILGYYTGSMIQMTSGAFTAIKKPFLGTYLIANGMSNFLFNRSLPGIAKYVAKTDHENYKKNKPEND